MARKAKTKLIANQTRPEKPLQAGGQRSKPERVSSGVDSPHFGVRPGGRRRCLTIRLALAASIAGMGGAVNGTEAPPRERAWRIVPMDAAAPRCNDLRLPPLATAATADQGGEEAGWRQTGELPAAFAAARQDWQKCLRQQGWRPTRQMPLNNSAGSRRELSAWQRQGRQLLLLLWENEPGRTGFAWGSDRQP